MPGTLTHPPDISPEHHASPPPEEEEAAAQVAVYEACYRQGWEDCLAAILADLRTRPRRGRAGLRLVAR
jgi:hypothetical protein